ncbi:MAG: flippase-like domain-containing protein [Clostridium sp.]|nr:flippase-like domain-containing protein [Clostridium sp.]
MWKAGLPFILGGAILWWMYRGLDWAELKRVLDSEVDWAWMLLSMPFGVTAQWFRGLRWRQLLEPLGEKPRRATCVHSVFLSYAASLIVPRVGEVLRCGVLRRYEGTSFARSVGTVVAERVVDMMLVLLIALVVGLTQLKVFFVFFEHTGMGLSGLLNHFSATGYWVTAVCLTVALAFGGVMMRRLAVFSRIRGTLLNLCEGFGSLRHVRGKTLFAVYSLAIWLSYFYHFYLTFRCFPDTAALGAVSAWVAFVVGSFAVLVPTPNGAGPWHFAVKTVLVLYGISEAPAVIFVLVVHTLQTLLVMALGLYALVALQFTSVRSGNAGSKDE